LYRLKLSEERMAVTDEFGSIRRETDMRFCPRIWLKRMRGNAPPLPEVPLVQEIRHRW
jgi:hypothetical protein